METDAHRGSPADQITSHGVVAVGDSWLSGYGLPLGGLGCLSWAGWLAWSRTECLTQHAVNGASAEQVARDQLLLLRHRRFRIGAAWLGANDLGRLDTGGFAAAVTTVCGALSGCCDVVAIATLPQSVRTPDLSWRQTERAVTRANVLIRQAAADNAATVVELEGALTGPWAMAPDRQHPTSLGQLEAAHVAAASLDVSTASRPLPDATGISLPADQQRLYRVSTRERLRGALVDVRQRQAERAVAGGRR